MKKKKLKKKKKELDSLVKDLESKKKQVDEYLKNQHNRTVKTQQENYLLRSILYRLRGIEVKESELTELEIGSILSDDITLENGKVTFTDNNTNIHENYKNNRN